MSHEDYSSPRKDKQPERMTIEEFTKEWILHSKDPFTTESEIIESATYDLNALINSEIERRMPNKAEWDENMKLRGELYFYDWLKSKLIK